VRINDLDDLNVLIPKTCLNIVTKLKPYSNVTQKVLLVKFNVNTVSYSVNVKSIIYLVPHFYDCFVVKIPLGCLSSALQSKSIKQTSLFRPQPQKTKRYM
jgi:hypothetical protein